mmetsp:Transcript_11349/g.30145  ORF Transcript_11349/g.30145 Transcript_11349/m.30145 type:complete len:529 (+) Transcript_11349:2-1588(+)
MDLPPLPGQQVHTLTDWGWLVLFSVCLAYLLHTAVYALRMGDLSKLDDVILEIQRNASDAGIRVPESVVEGEELLKAQDSLFKMLEYARRNLELVWYVMPLCLLTSAAAGFAYIRFLHEFVHWMVRICALLLVFLPMGWGSYCMFQYSGEPSHFMFQLGALIFVAGVGMGFIVSRSAAILEGAAGSLEATSECLLQQRTLQLEPFVVVVTKVLVNVSMAVVLARLATCLEHEDVTELEYLEGIVKTPPVPHHVKVKMAFVVFMTVWLNTLSVTLMEYVATSVVQGWYFTPYVNGMKLDVRPRLHREAYHDALFLHFGSLLCGALLIPLAKIPYQVMNLVNMASTDDSAVGRCIAATCCCCIRVFNAVLQPLSKHALIQLAASSAPFLASGRSYQKVVKASVEWKYLAANNMQELFMLAGILLITVCTSLLSLGFCEKHIVHRNVDARPLLIATAAIGWVVGNTFIRLFDMVSDTIMYCWMLQEGRYKVGPYRAAQAGRSVFGWKLQDGPVRDGKINYAPACLRQYQTS